MFTGIVEEVGRIVAAGAQESGFSMTVTAPLASRHTRLGDSIAVNGACLTVSAFGELNATPTLTFGLAPETLARTNLGQIGPGEAVNLERALPASGRFDGHIVQGHIDGTGIVEAVTPDGDSLRYRISAGSELMRYIVPKGFIAVDGVSLTVIDADQVAAPHADAGPTPGGFSFMLIAYTQSHIALPGRPEHGVGNRVNLEVDILAKYVERLLVARELGQPTD